MSMDIRIGTIVRVAPGCDDYIRQILPHGFESISLMFWQKTAGTDWERLAGQVREALDGSGAILNSIGVYGNPMEADGVEILQGFEQAIDHAGDFGCDIVEGFTGRLRGVSMDGNREAYVKTWEPLAKRAADKGVRIAFENCAMGGTWSGGDWNLAHYPAAWEMMFNALPNENMGLAWEPCHQVIKLIDPIPQIQVWKDRIFTVHGKDANVDWDHIRRHGVNTIVSDEAATICGIDRIPKFSMQRTPGYGDTDWRKVFTELRLAGYSGCIDIEGWHDRTFKGELEMTGQVSSLNYLKTCRGGDYTPNPTV